MDALLESLGQSKEDLEKIKKIEEEKDKNIVSFRDPSLPDRPGKQEGSEKIVASNELEVGQDQ